MKNKYIFVLLSLFIFLTGCSSQTSSQPEEEQLELTETETAALPETEPETEFIWTEPPTEPPAPDVVFINYMHTVEVKLFLTKLIVVFDRFL